MATSPNAPMLVKILDAINGINVRLDTIERNTELRFDKLETRMAGLETRMTGLETRMSGVESRLSTVERKITSLESGVASLTSYKNNETRAQEIIFTNRLKEALEEDEYMYPTYTIRVLPFGNFYTPASNSPLTDIDGCLFIKGNQCDTNNVLKHLMNDAVYFIESKHGFTKTLVDYKLKQFCTILTILNDIRTKKLVPNTPPKTHFDTMVTNYNLTRFPADIRFVFASDYIDPDLTEFILAINSGSINEEVYNTYLMRQFYSHPFINDVLNDNNVKSMCKSIFREGVAPITDIYNLFVVKDPSAIKNKADAAYEKAKQSIMPYKERILNLLPPFNTVKQYYQMLRGRLSVFYDGEYIREPFARNASLLNG